MKASFINVGYGDAILIEHNDPEGKYNILIDGGSSLEEEYWGFPQRIRAIDYLKEKGIKKINLLVITHLHEDHVCGLLDVVHKIEIDNVWCNYIFPEELLGIRLQSKKSYSGSLFKLTSALDAYNEISCVLKAKNVGIKEISGSQLGMKIHGSLLADVLGPAYQESEQLRERIQGIYSGMEQSEIDKMLVELDRTVNNSSIILRFSCNSRSILLPGDVYNTYWEKYHLDLLSLKSDVLKVPHHGQKDAISERLMDAVSPAVAVICTSSDRRYDSVDSIVAKIISKYESASNIKTNFYFTDALDLPPHSTPECLHKAVAVSFERDSVLCRYE